MNEIDFRELVQRMRRAQRDYFRTRSRDVLDESRDLERQVDAELDADQQTLFEENPLR